MDATPGILAPHTRETPAPAPGRDQPMSVDILRELLEDGATSIDELSVLLGGLSKSGTYRYTEATELRFGQLMVLLRQAGDDRVRRAFLNKMLPASGWQVTRLPEAMDVDGDGDIDTDDALAQMVQSLGPTQQALQALQSADSDAIDPALTAARAAVTELIEHASATLAVIDYIDKHTPRRRKAVQRG